MDKNKAASLLILFLKGEVVQKSDNGIDVSLGNKVFGR